MIETTPVERVSSILSGCAWQATNTIPSGLVEPTIFIGAGIS